MHMKQEKISPKGKPSEASVRVRALFKAAVQKKMKRYIAPSKKHEAAASDRIRISRFRRQLSSVHLQSFRSTFENCSQPGSRSFRSVSHVGTISIVLILYFNDQLCPSTHDKHEPRASISGIMPQRDRQRWPGKVRSLILYIVPEDLRKHQKQSP